MKYKKQFIFRFWKKPLFIVADKLVRLNCASKLKNLPERERETICLIASRILLEMNCCGQWKSVVVMIAVNFGLAITNVLFKKILDKGVSLIIILMYRQAISAVFLAPIAYFWER